MHGKKFYTLFRLVVDNHFLAAHGSHNCHNCHNHSDINGTGKKESNCWGLEPRYGDQIRIQPDEGGKASKT